jgi:hypothetical protein
LVEKKMQSCSRRNRHVLVEASSKFAWVGAPVAVKV